MNSDSEPRVLQAVLFDLDGTLLDTGPLWDDALVEFVSVNGGELPRSIVAATHGIDSTEAIRLAHESQGWSERDINADVAWMQEAVRQKLELGLPWRSGAERLLALVRSAGIPCGLVTATYRELVEYMLGTLGSFDVVICGDDVEQSKPHPAPYLSAVGTLGVDVSHCVAVEDSPTGIESATRAGCAVLAVPQNPEMAFDRGREVGLSEITLGDLECSVVQHQRSLATV